MTRATKILIKLAGCAVLAAALLGGALMSLDKEMITGRIALILKDTTGLDVSFQGPVSLRWFPWIGLELRSVSVASLGGPGTGPLARLDRVDVGLRLLPLIRGRVESRTITLEGLELNVVRDASGELNLPKLKIKDVRVEGRSVVVTTDDDTTFRLDYEIAGLNVSGTRLNYRDERSGLVAGVSGLSLRTGSVKRGQPFDVSLGFDFAASTPELSGHFQLEGKATAVPEALRFSFENIGLKAAVAGPALPVSPLETAGTGSLAYDGNAGILRGDGLQTTLTGVGPSPLTLGLTLLLDQKADTLDITDLKVAAQGAALAGGARVTALTADPTVEAAMSLARCNLREVLSGLGVKLPPTADPTAFGAAQAAFTLRAKGGAASLRTQSLELDSTKLSLAADYTPASGQGRPRLAVSLKGDSINLDHYQPVAEHGPGKGKQPPAADKPPLVPGLGLDLDAVLEMASLTASRLHMGPVSAKATLKEGVLAADPVNAALYQGSLKAALKADLRHGRNVPLSATVSVEGVQLEPLLRDATGAARVAGRATANASVTATGVDSARLLSSLGGKASFAVRGGALLGLEVTPEALQTGLGQAKSGARTPFEQVSASASISGGVAHTSDLLVAMSPHKVTGQGWVNLSSQTLDMRLMASFVKLPAIPVLVTGKLDDPSVSLDKSAMAQGVLDSVVNAPKEVLKAPGNLGKGALDAVGGILGMPKKK